MLRYNLIGFALKDKSNEPLKLESEMNSNYDIDLMDMKCGVEPKMETCDV